MKPTPIELEGAVVAITGAGRGVGRATARAFAALGAQVAAADIDTDTAQLSAGELGPPAQPFAVDVADRESFAEFVAATEDAMGPIDVLVNSAAVMAVGRFVEEVPDTTATVLDVNVRGPMNGMQLVLPGMLARGRGHVVNVASGAGRVAVPGAASYCASKHAVVGLSGAVAGELRDTGVSVTAVLPSALGFPLQREIRASPEAVAEAIVASVRTRPREVTVPGWMAHYQRLTALLPDELGRVLRVLIDDARPLTGAEPDDGRSPRAPSPGPTTRR